MELTPIIKESFSQYAGAVLQSRALVDVRDCLKPSARQIFYSMWRNKYIHSKPYEKTNAPMGDAMKDFYIHGNSSCIGIMMRAAQDFSMRYPLCEVKGNVGTLMSSGNWASERYTSTRLSQFSDYLFEDIQKNTINEWRDNYADNLQYPAVLPSKGFYNIVNGTSGIGVGMGSSIPQFNLRELNEALIKLLWNPNCDFEDIYCAPDFATGGILLNEEEVKESLKNGRGKSCKLRSVIEYDNKERCLIITEIPYSVYTNTICGELEKILELEENPGIDRFNDLTGSNPLIKIYLTRGANLNKVLKYLYKNTSLQYYYGINMTMLENGRYPKVFSWKETLQSYIDHEINVYRQGFIFDLNKIKKRLHIIEGLLKAISILDEIIVLIKNATDTKNAFIKLQQNFDFSEEQAKAILEIKLARLAKLEINKLEKEKNELEKEKNRIENILQDENLLKKEIEKGLQEVSNKFGDERRTKILNIENESDEPTEVHQLILNFTNHGNIFISESSSLYTQRKGSIGNKFKLEKGEYVVSNMIGDNTDIILFFSNKGNFYHTKMNDFPVEEKIHISSLVSLHSYEEVRAATILSKNDNRQYIIFITKQGIIKKSLISEYNIKRNGGARAIELNNNDEIISVLFTNEEPLAILSAQGSLLLTQTKDIRAIGRISKGVKGIKLNEGDYVVSARTVQLNPKEILSISKNGLSKRTDFNEFVYTGKNTKGKKIQKIIDNDFMADFLLIDNDKNILVVSSLSQLKVNLDEIPKLNRGTQGSKTIKLKDNSRVISLQKI